MAIQFWTTVLGFFYYYYFETISFDVNIIQSKAEYLTLVSLYATELSDDIYGKILW